MFMRIFESVVSEFGGIMVPLWFWQKLEFEASTKPGCHHDFIKITDSKHAHSKQISAWVVNSDINIIIIVSLLIIYSACPEKISEFEEKKALRKKQNVQKRRPKKKETTSSLAELDLKLQNLLLDDNLQDDTNHSASDSSGRILEETTSTAEDDLNTENMMLSHDDIEYNEWIQNISNISSNDVVSSKDKNVVIDLLSPSPLKPSNSSKFHPSSDQNIEVINLSDSENEVTPEHKQKAKELRMFLASIRNEIHWTEGFACILKKV